MSKKSLFITGGAGYVGAVLVPRLLSDGHKVTVLDLMIYGDDVIDAHPNLKIVKGDIRDIDLVNQIMPGHDTVIHLACISNDPSFELNPDLGRSINLDSFEPLVKASKDLGIKRFINASSSSVYGIKNEKDVSEEMSLEPLTDYSKFKAECELILTKYQSEDFTTVSVRPATVCGYSPRQRLDVVVNILTNLAFHQRKIKVFGGNQLRPNIHIEDMVEVYCQLIDAPSRMIAGEIFNAGYENQSVMELAQTVGNAFENSVEIEVTPSNDDRSYHISSAKIKKLLGFETKHTIADAVRDLKAAFEEGRLKNPIDNELYYNIRRMQALSLK